MLIVNLTGGLGNQMFQYAFGANLSKSIDMPLKVHFTDAVFCTKRDYSLDCFKNIPPVASLKEISSTGFPKTILGRLFYRFLKKLNLIFIFYPNIITEKNFIEKIKNISPKENYYCEGYWQGEKYLKELKEITKLFAFKSKLSPQSIQICEKMISTNSIAVHIRRGDYVSSSSVRRVFIPCSKEYYSRCFKYIEKKIKSPHYFIFSDDINWAKKNILTKHQTYFVEGNKPWEDMYLMSICKHNIIANSSFSWWAAMLNKNINKIVLLPEKWTTAKLSKELSMVASSWTLINN